MERDDVEGPYRRYSIKAPRCFRRYMAGISGMCADLWGSSQLRLFHFHLGLWRSQFTAIGSHT